MSRTLGGVRWIDPERGIDQVVDVEVDHDGPRPRNTPSTDGGGERWLIPALIDLAARTREPGATHKADIASEARAAWANGIEAFALPPDTEPGIESTAVVELILERAARAGGARVLPIAALTAGRGEAALSEMAALTQAGCIAVGQFGRSLGNSAVLRRALQYAATLDLTVILQPLDPWLAEDACAHDGRIAARLGLPGIPESAETLALARDLMLIEETGVRAHIARLSCARSVDMIAAAKARGLPITCDVAMHQLFLSEHDLIGFDPNAHVLPPLRRPEDREALRAGVRYGVIDAICSDHSPHDRDAKLAPFPLTEAGISGLDTFLGLGLTLVHDGVLDLARWLECCALTPARILGYRRQGWLLLDPHADWAVVPERFHSRGRNTPFAGWRLPGAILERFPAAGPAPRPLHRSPPAGDAEDGRRPAPGATPGAGAQ